MGENSAERSFVSGIGGIPQAADSGGIIMYETSYYLTAKEVAKAIPCSMSLAYKLIRQWNEKLEKQGKIVIRGKVNRKFFEKQMEC